MNPVQSPSHPTLENRLGGFDVVRVGAALGVVALHASAPYLAPRMPGLTWPVFDHPSAYANFLGWSIELFIMPLFLLMAGYFTPGILERRGDWGFVKNRFARLLVPLGVAMFLILPADLYVWLTGWLIEGRIAPRKLLSLKFDNGLDEGLWGLSHLWFLLYLFLYAIGWLAFVRLWQRFYGGSASRREPRNRVSYRASVRRIEAFFRWQPRNQVCLLAVVGWIVLVGVPKVVFGFQHAFLPVPSKWLYSGTYFLGGVFLYQNAVLQSWCSTRWRAGVTLGLLTNVCGVFLGCRMMAEDLAGESAVGLRILATLFTVTSAWSLSLGLVGWALQYKRPASKLLRYLAAASFWVYLVHHPIIGLAHIQLKVMFPEWPSAMKMIAALTTAVVFSLLSFEFLVRRWPMSGLLATAPEFAKPHPQWLRRDGQDPASTLATEANPLKTRMVGGKRSFQGDSSIGRSPQPWPGSSSASTP